MHIQEVETPPACADIWFAIDDFDSTFDAAVLGLIIIWPFTIVLVNALDQSGA